MWGRKEGREKCPAEHTDSRRCGGMKQLSCLRAGFGESSDSGCGHCPLTEGAWVAPVCALPRPGITVCRGYHVLILCLG